MSFAKQDKQREVQTLLLWINHILNTNLKEIIQLWNGDIFHQILSKITQFDLRPYKSNPCNAWQLCFTNAKIIYRSIELFWTKTLGKSWQAHAHIDMLKLAKQRNQDQIFELLILVFGSCIQSSQKEKFMEPIYKFNQIEHGQFLAITQKYKFADNLLDSKVVQIKDLMTKTEVLEIQNDNLQKAMNDQLIQLQLLQQSINYLTQENKKLKEQLKASTPMIQNYIQQSIISSNSTTHLNASISSSSKLSEDTKTIQTLKAKIHSDKQTYLKQTNQLKETIQFLKQTISGNRKERGVSSRRLSKGISQRMQTDHPPCVSLVKYQQVVFSQTQKIKELTKNETENKQKIRKLQNDIVQINKKIQQKKVVEYKQKQKQKQGLITSYQKEASQNSLKIIQINILEGIKMNLERVARRRLIELSRSKAPSSC